MEEKENVKKPKSKTRKIIEWVLTSIIGVVFLFVAACNVSMFITKRDHNGHGNAFGYSSYVVLTDSMEPIYPVQSAIITYLDSPEEIIKAFENRSTDERDSTQVNLAFSYSYRSDQPLPHPEQYPHIRKQTKPVGVQASWVMTHQLFDYKINDEQFVKNGAPKYFFFVRGINVESHSFAGDQYQVFTERELLGRVRMVSNFIGGVSKFLTSWWGLLICLMIPALYLMTTSVIDIFKAYKDPDEVTSTGVTTTTDKDGNIIKNVDMSGLSDAELEKLKKEMIDEMLNGKDKK